MALVQGKASDTAAASLSLSFTSSVTAGDIIVVGVSAFNATTLSTPTTSGTAVLSALTHFLASNLSAVTCLANVWVAKVTTGGSLTIASSATGSVGGVGMCIAEFDGTWGSTQIDGTLTSSGSGTGTAVAASSITPTANDLVVGFEFNSGNGGISQTPGTNYLDGTSGTDHSLNSAAGNVNCSMEWWVDAAGSATTAPWTLGVSNTWGDIAGALKPTSGGTAFMPRPGLTIRQAVNRAGTY